MKCLLDLSPTREEQICKAEDRYEAADVRLGEAWERERQVKAELDKKQGSLDELQPKLAQLDQQRALLETAKPQIQGENQDRGKGA